MLRVDRDAEEFDGRIVEHRDVVAKLAELALADTREGEREEDEGDGLHAAEVGESHRLPELVDEIEVGRDGSGLEDH